MGKNINEKFYSKDGKYYDTQIEAVAANYAWDQQMGLQKEQNRLLEEQNRAINYQTQMEYQRLEQQRKLENEKIKLEHDKIQHEKEMRLFKLFDDAGISKKLYDRFINYLEHGGSDNASKTKQDIIKEHELLKSSIEYTTFDDGETIETANEDIILENKEYFCKLIPNYFKDIKIKGSKNEKLMKIINADEEEKRKRENKNSWFISISIVSSIISFISFVGELDVVMIVISTCLIALAVVMLILYFTGRTEISIVNSRIESNREKLPYSVNHVGKDYRDIIKNRIKELENDYSKLIEKDAKDFYNFRLNHYNSVIEKLLMDVEFNKILESYNIEYKQVNIKDKKKDGSIEDYIEYFSK